MHLNFKKRKIEFIIISFRLFFSKQLIFIWVVLFDLEPHKGEQKLVKRKIKSITKRIEEILLKENLSVQVSSF